MKELTWFQAFFRSPSLKQLRAENNLEVPEWYTNSVYKLALVVSTWSILTGLGLGYLIGIF